MEVHSTQGRPISYKYDCKDRIIQKNLPEGRCLAVQYHRNGKGKVKYLKAPVGIGGALVPTHTFRYRGNKVKRTTSVKDAAGYETLYTYKKGRLSTLSRYDGDQRICWEKFRWDARGNLLSQEFHDRDQSVFEKKLIYDESGNVSQEILTGNLTGKGEQEAESYVKNFSSTQDSWHLPLEEKGETLWKRFAYLPKSNLLKSRLTGSGDGIGGEGEGEETILKREFFEYDSNGFCIQEILDDGNQEDPRILDGVTERHLKKITPTKSFPFFLPEKIDTFYQENGAWVPLRTVIYRYSPQGKKLEEKHYGSDNLLAFTLEWEYDARDNLLSQKDALGQVVYCTYDANNNKLSEQHPHLLKTFTYDLANRLIQEQEVWPDGTTLINSHRYNTLNQREASVDVYGNEILYAYDCLGHLSQITHPILPDLSRPIERKKFDALGNNIVSWDPLGFATQTAYTIRGQPYNIQHPDGSLEKKEYTLEGRLKKEIAKNGVETIYTRDPFGRVIKKEVRSPSGVLLKSTSAIYSTFHLLSETDEEGFTTYFSYDAAGRKIREEKEGKVITLEYDPLGRVSKTIKWVDPQTAQVTVTLYNLLDRVIEERVEELSGEVFKRVLYAYDAAGNRSHTTTFTEKGPSVSSTTYTPQGKPICHVDPLGNTTHTHYDFEAIYQGVPVLKVSSVDPLGNQDVSLHDSFGNVLLHSRLNALGECVQQEIHTYDLCHRLIASQSAGYLVTWERDCMGRETCCTEGKGTLEQKKTYHAYNPQGQKSATLTPNGITIFYSYDLLGRLETERSSNGEIHHLYTYDKRDLPITLHNEVFQAKTFKAYDSLGRLMRETLETGLQMAYYYDFLDRLTKLTLPDQTEIRFVYNGCRLHSIERIKNGKTIYTHRYTRYDLSGHPLSEKLACEGKIDREYDLLHRVASLKVPFRNESLFYDAVGNLIAKDFTDPKGTSREIFAYDALYQLVKEGEREEAGEQESQEASHNYRYDSLYNRLEKDGKSYAVNSLNQLVSTEGVSYFYDCNGNLIEKSVAGEKTFYAYDPLNRLTKVTTPYGSTSYTYDPQHRRLKKTHQGQVIKYLYQEDIEIGAYANGVLKELRVLGQGIAADIGAAVAFEKGDTLYVPLHDALGNVCLVLDAAGKPLETLRYTAFGQETSGACSKFSPWQYASKRLDQESGFYYFCRRHYDPNVGRWMTPDPLGFEDGLNLYSYVHNSPLNHIDPDGQFAFLIPIAVGFLISHAIDYVLPVAVSYAGQYAGGTAAALLSGALNGYNMNYSQGLFANDPALGSTEKLGMAIGTLFSLGNPAKLAKAGTVIATAAKRELVNYGTNLASKRIGNACSLTEKTARKLASQTAATCAKTIEKTTEKALEKTAEKATTIAAEKGLAKVAKEGVTEVVKQKPNNKILQIEEKISEWLGKETKMIKNEAKDLIFISKDGKRKVRFDLNNTVPHAHPHGHVEEFFKSWNKSGPIYPTDVPHY